MSSTEYHHDDGDGYVTELISTETQTAEVSGHLPYRVFRVSLSDGQLTNDGTDTETATVKVVDGLEVARGTTPSNATVLDYNGDVTLTIDGAAVTRTASSGVATVDVTTEKAAGSTIEVGAVGLDGVPAESDSAVIEVVSA